MIQTLIFSGRSLSLMLSGFILLCATGHAQTPLLKMRADGPDAIALGQEAGYKPCPQALLKPECRVGAWSAPASAFSRYTPPLLHGNGGFSRRMSTTSWRRLKQQAC
jgi:hypothetical protein